MKKALLVLLLISCSSMAFSQEVAFPFSSVHGSTKEPLKIHVKNELGEKSYLETHMPKGEIYLVSVWATWCGSCRSKLRAIQKIHCEWSEKYDFEFVAVSIDTPTDNAKVFNMANGKDWNFKILHDEYGYLVKELEILRLPRTFLVDRNGIIVYEPKGHSESAMKALEEKIKAL